MHGNIVHEYILVFFKIKIKKKNRSDGSVLFGLHTLDVIKIKNKR